MLCALASLAAPPLEAQPRSRIQQETSFHADAGGTPLGTLYAGRTVPIVRASGAWREITLESWIWTASVGPTSRDGFDVVVTPTGGENLRVEPNGTLVGKALEGALFARVRRQGGWTRVRRRVWVPAAAFQQGGQVAPGVPGVQRAQGAQGVPAGPVASAGDTTPPAPRPRSAEVREPVIIRRRAALHAGPGAEVLGEVPRDLRAEVTERASGWVKVRAEIWVREEDVAPAPLSSDEAVTLRALQSEPEKYLGREVLWRLQYLSLQVADELRPELPAGEPYVLARGPLPEAGFVYLVVTRAQAERFRGMQPLSEFVARGTIVSPRTRYLPTPVIQLQRMP